MQLGLGGVLADIVETGPVLHRVEAVPACFGEILAHVYPDEGRQEETRHHQDGILARGVEPRLGFQRPVLPLQRGQEGLGGEGLSVRGLGEPFAKRELVCVEEAVRVEIQEFEGRGQHLGELLHRGGEARGIRLGFRIGEEAIPVLVETLEGLRKEKGHIGVTDPAIAVPVVGLESLARLARDEALQATRHCGAGEKRVRALSGHGGRESASRQGKCQQQCES
ncbi:hypothetical protein D3C87_923430 [compost metagenome]